MLTTILRILFWGTLALILAGFLHYTLPQRDVVQIVGVDVRRTDVGARPLFWARPDTGQAALENRDVRFIRTVYPDGTTMEFRNEDTGLGWPPYLKFDSDELQTKATVAARGDEWVVVRHYGWRSNLFSIYPNALSIRPAAGPGDTPFPWTAAVVLILLGALFWAVATRWRRFKRARISPVLDDMDAAWDARRARMRERRARRAREKAERIG
ncbi:uncharacterized protein DUF1523 [Hasllibacter halocynthiae]|uniref:Uncharacterized protein DUF1523 n=1 Tax=Hasllibacter halocynthiae TaxID=595589 RepID=A0A2T0X1H8_9RHOB|nr:DUF1523 family protein [Hasllibacter halocynthiae]PRY92714.1 uncharacterized protein DUF1523 [Hasllibacter halocynthiae]